MKSATYWSLLMIFNAGLTTINVAFHSPIAVFTGFMTVWTMLMAYSHYVDDLRAKDLIPGPTGATGATGQPGTCSCKCGKGPTIKQVLLG